MYWAPQILPPVRFGWCGLVKTMSLVFARLAERLLLFSQWRAVLKPAMAELVVDFVVAEVAKMVPSLT